MALPDYTTLIRRDAARRLNALERASPDASGLRQALDDGTALARRLDQAGQAIEAIEVQRLLDWLAWLTQPAPDVSYAALRRAHQSDLVTEADSEAQQTRKHFDSEPKGHRGHRKTGQSPEVSTLSPESPERVYRDIHARAGRTVRVEPTVEPTVIRHEPEARDVLRRTERSPSKERSPRERSPRRSQRAMGPGSRVSRCPTPARRGAEWNNDWNKPEESSNDWNKPKEHSKTALLQARLKYRAPKKSSSAVWKPAAEWASENHERASLPLEESVTESVQESVKDSVKESVKESVEESVTASVTVSVKRVTWAVELEQSHESEPEGDGSDWGEHSPQESQGICIGEQDDGEELIMNHGAFW